MQTVLKYGLKPRNMMTRPGVRLGSYGMRTPSYAMPMSVRYNSQSSDKKEASDTATDGGEAAKEAPTSESPVSEQDEVINELKTKLATKDKQLADMKNHYAKAVADFRNLQESTKKEVQKAKDFALQKFAKDLIVSLDNFTLALQSVKQDTLSSNEEVKNLYDGVEMTRSVFEKTLTSYGITKIDPMGEPFDPNHHEATFEIPQPDKEPGTVFHVQQPGYTLNSRVLRPAKVGIVKGEN